MSEAHFLDFTDACDKGDIDKVQALLSPPHEPTEGKLRVGFYVAAKGRNAALLSVVLAQGVSFRPYGVLCLDYRTPLEVFQVLLDHGWDLKMSNEEGVPLLCCVAGSFETTRWFLEHGAKALIYGRDLKCPIQYAALHPNQDTVDILVEYGASVSESNALQAAARAEGDDISILAHLLNLGAQINGVDNWWNPAFKNEHPTTFRDSPSVRLTALQWAVKYNKVNKAKFLLVNGADPDKESVPVGKSYPPHFIWTAKSHVLFYKKTQFYEMFGLDP